MADLRSLLAVCALVVLWPVAPTAADVFVSLTLYNDSLCRVPYPAGIYDLSAVPCPLVGVGSSACLNSSSASAASSPLWSAVSVYCVNSGDAYTPYYSLNVNYWTNSAQSCNSGVSGVNAIHFSGPGAADLDDPCNAYGVLTRPDAATGDIQATPVYGTFNCSFPIALGVPANSALATVDSRRPRLVSLATSLACTVYLALTAFSAGGGRWDEHCRKHAASTDDARAVAPR